MCTIQPATYCGKVSKRPDDRIDLTAQKKCVKPKDMTINTEETSYMPDARWLYRGEGNRCLVVADARDKSERIHHVLKDMGDYMNNVLSLHLSPHFSIHPRLVELSREFINNVAEHITHFRPELRRSRNLDPNCRSALTLPDLCFLRDTPPSPLPTISIEIKPKRGILPVDTPICVQDHIQRAPCRFCMHQTLKVNQKIWSSRSKYCPVDLFSGNPTRMKKALSGLLETPQNNLKIFKNGVEIYPHCSISEVNSCLVDFFRGGDGATNGKPSHLTHLVNLVIRALLWSPSDRGDNDDARGHNSTLPAQFCDASTSVPKTGIHESELPQGCVLERLRYMQLIDQLEINQIYPLYQRLQSHHVPSQRCKWNIDGPYSHDWLSPLHKHCDTNSAQYALHKIKEFLISTTVSDCSVMIAIQPSAVTNHDASNCHVTSPSTNHTLRKHHVTTALSNLCSQNHRVSNQIADGHCTQTSNQTAINRVTTTTTNHIATNSHVTSASANGSPEKRHVIYDDQGRQFVCSIGVIDLDPKPFGKIPTYYKRKAEIVDSYNDSLL